MNSQALKKLNIPDKPGVYFFKKGKNILYIGKATSLRDRTRSYFSKDLIQTRGPLIVDMVFKADTVEWQETDSVLEALILEANLIKKHHPIYNTKEKDDKSFNYVCITKEELPRVLIVRGKELGDAAFLTRLALPRQSTGSARAHTYSSKKQASPNSKLLATFGPFPHGQQLREAMKIVRKIFPFLDKKTHKEYSYEFYRQLGLVPEVGNAEAQKEYKKNIKNLILFFQGKKSMVVKNLEKEMYVLAKKREFERANEAKKKIFALKHIHDVALIKSDAVSSSPLLRGRLGGGRIESYDIAHMSGKNMVGVMTVVENGEVNKNEYRKFIIKSQIGSNDTGALLEVLERRFNHSEWAMPSLIVVDGGVAQMNTALKFQERVGLAIPVVAVTKDERHKAKKILGDQKLIRQYEKEILLANSEAHRFAIGYHRQKRGKGMFE